MSVELSGSDLRPGEIIKRVEFGEFTLTESDSRSRIWLTFARIQKPDGELIPDYIFCKMCFKVFKYNKKSTSNLVKHRCYIARKKGPDDSMLEDDNSTMDDNEIFIDDDNKSANLTKIVINNSHLTKLVTKRNNLTSLVTRWIVNEYQSYDLLQSEGLNAIFKEIAMLGSQFGGDLDILKLLPTVSDVTENINEIYEPCFEQVKSEIALNREHGFGLTCDIRNDNLTRRTYVLLTAHYMKNDVPTVRFLGLRKMEDERSKNEHILRKIDEILADFDCSLSSRFILVTESSNDFYKNIPNAQTLPCMSQLLSNALFRAIEEIPEIMELITNCSNLVNFLTKKGQEHIFGSSVKSAEHNAGLTTLNMLHLIQNNWNEIENLLQCMKEKEKILTISVTHLNAVVKTLQPFQEAMETLEDDSSPTLHLVIMYLHELKKSCDTTGNEFGDFEFIDKLKENLKHNLQKIETENVTILHKVALFLYPLTKKLLQFSESEKKLIEDECLRLMQNCDYQVPTVVEHESDSPTSSPLSKRRKLLCDFMESENQEPNELFTQEIQFYKIARVINKTDFNVFKWWQMQTDNFPQLSKLCCTLLATPATCAASKRIFSAGSCLLARKSTQLTKEADLEKILFVNTNAKHDKW